MKKTPSKVAHNRPRTFFSVLARLPKRPKNRNPVPPKAKYCRTGYLDWGLCSSSNKRSLKEQGLAFIRSKNTENVHLRVAFSVSKLCLYRDFLGRYTIHSY